MLLMDPPWHSLAVQEYGWISPTMWICMTRATAKVAPDISSPPLPLTRKPRRRRNTRITFVPIPHHAPAAAINTGSRSHPQYGCREGGHYHICAPLLYNPPSPPKRPSLEPHNLSGCYSLVVSGCPVVLIASRTTSNVSVHATCF